MICMAESIVVRKHTLFTTGGQVRCFYSWGSSLFWGQIEGGNAGTMGLRCSLVSLNRRVVWSPIPQTLCPKRKQHKLSKASFAVAKEPGSKHRRGGSDKGAPAGAQTQMWPLSPPDTTNWSFRRKHASFRSVGGALGPGQWGACRKRFAMAKIPPAE